MLRSEQRNQREHEKNISLMARSLSRLSKGEKEKKSLIARSFLERGKWTCLLNSGDELLGHVS